MGTHFNIFQVEQSFVLSFMDDDNRLTLLKNLNNGMMKKNQYLIEFQITHQNIHLAVPCIRHFQTVTQVTNLYTSPSFIVQDVTLFLHTWMQIEIYQTRQ